MIKTNPKTPGKRRQNPWYKNQVGSLDRRHSILSDKVRALKAFANHTEVALQETQAELTFALEAIRELASRIKYLEGKNSESGDSVIPEEASELVERPVRRKAAYWVD